MIKLLFFFIILLSSINTYAQVNISGTTCPGNGCRSINIAGLGSIGIQITGTWVGTITFKGSLGTTSTSTFDDLLVLPLDSTTQVNTVTSNGTWTAPIAGLNQIRIQFTSYTSGIATISYRAVTSVRNNGPSGGGGGSGSVTSVGLTAPTAIFDISGSPITTNGTLALSLDTQTAATFLAGPTSGSAVAPTFRAITLTDLPGGVGLGSVTSVGLALPNIFSVSGSPVTTSGTLTGALATQTANRVFAGPTTGSAAAPTFRALVAADISGLTGAGTVTSAALALPTSVFDISGSPITSSGTLTATFDNQSANTFFSGPTTGGATTPTFRVLNANDLAGLIPPLNATYITQTTNSTLTNEQAMASLATGIVKNTTTTGVQSIAASSDVIATFTGVPGSDMVLVSDGTLGQISTGFDVVTSGTNTVAAMLVGSGASISTTGTGNNKANYISNLGTTAPSGTDCDDVAETGKLFWDATNDNLYVCSGASGWRKIATAAP